MNTNLPVKQEKKGFFAKLGGFFRKIFGIKEKSLDESNFASVMYDEGQTNGINFGNGYKYDQMMQNESQQAQNQASNLGIRQPQNFNMSDTQKLVYENSTAFVPTNYMYMNNVANQTDEQQPLAIASDIDKKEIVVPSDMKTEPVVEDQNAIVKLNDDIDEGINMGILDVNTERALDELDEYFADEDVANDYVEEEIPVKVPTMQEYTIAEKFDKLIENVDLTYSLEPELKEVFDDPAKQDQIREIIEIVEANPDSLDNLDMDGLKLIDAYYKREILLAGERIKAANA